MSRFRLGWYRISYSDGGMDYTNEGPVWIGSPGELVDLWSGARETATDTHLPCLDYYGDGDEPSDEPMD